MKLTSATLTACYQYTLEYNGRYPYGFIWNNQNVVTGRNVPGQTQQITWYSSLDKYLTTGNTANFPSNGTSPFIDGSTNAGSTLHSAVRPSPPTLNNKLPTTSMAWSCRT